MKEKKFSVLMSIYYKENPAFLKETLNSVFTQTVQPDEVILVEDGELTDELNDVISIFKKKYSTFKVLKFKDNRGLGPALNDGLKKCKNELVFRMDTDDICRNDRFEVQLKYMNENPLIDVLGSNIYEFKENINENMRKKVMPASSEISNYIKKRNPINHMTVCFRKSSVIECGGYKPMLYLEDYYLWVRMLKHGKIISNIQDELVYARIGNGFEKRRGNKKQIIGWKKLQKFMLEEKMINYFRYCINILNMYLLVYCPDFVRKFIYKTVLRKEK